MAGEGENSSLHFYCPSFSPSGSQFGVITDNFTVTVLDTFDENCIFVQTAPCNMEFVVHITF